MPFASMQRRICFFFALAILFTPLWTARAGDLITIVAQDVEPLVISDGDGMPRQGILVDLMTMVERQSNHIVEIVTVPTKRGLAEYRAGKEQAIIFLINNGLEDHSAKSIPLIPVNRVYAARFDTAFHGLQDAKKLRTAVMLGAGIGSLPTQYHPPEDKIIRVPSVDQMATMLQRNRFEAIIGSDIFIYYYLQKLNKGPEYLHEPVLLEKSAIALHLGPATRHAVKWMEFEKALRSVLDSSEYRIILRRYLGDFSDVLG